jgi:hypothetical protein
MSETKEPGHKLPDSAATAPPQSGWRKVLVRVGGIVLTAVVTSVVAWAVDWPKQWFNDNIINPDKYLAATVTVPSPEPSCQGGGTGWVFDKGPQQLPGVPPRGDVNAWATANGGIPASGNYVNVDVQGLDGHTVVVDSISVNVVSRAEPLQGTWAETWAQCGGLIPYRFQLNLDTAPVAITAIPDEGAGPAGGERRPVDLPHSVNGSEPEVWHLTAVTTTCTCEWTATLNWTSDGKQGHTDLTDNGHPFRVAAVTRSTHVKPDNGGWMLAR